MRPLHLHCAAGVLVIIEEGMVRVLVEEVAQLEELHLAEAQHTRFRHIPLTSFPRRSCQAEERAGWAARLRGQPRLARALKC